MATKAQVTYIETDLDATDYNGVQTVTVSPDGKFVYAAAANADELVIFTRNESNGTLEYGTAVSHADLDNVRGPVISSDGAFAYTISLQDDKIVKWTRNTTTGELTHDQVLTHNTGGVTDMDGPLYLIMSPDEKQIYVSVQTSDALVVFDRNTTTGDLTFKESHVNNTGGITNFDSPKELSISPDGKNIYIIGQTNDALHVFDRNTTTGALTYNEHYRDGVTAPTLLDSPFAVRVSPDGNFVYATSRGEDAITVFSRNSSTGDLTVAFEYEGSDLGTTQLTDPYSLVFQTDGSELFLAGGSADAVLAFDVNTSTGALNLNNEVKQEDATVTAEALNNVYWVTIEPGGEHIYVGLQNGDGVTTLSVDNPPTSAPSSVTVAVTAILEGAWNGSNAMNTHLEEGGLIPTADPYDGLNGHDADATPAVASIPDGVVDWVLVELREADLIADADDGSRVGSAAGFLMEDGSIVATNGSSNLSISLSGNSGADFYVVVYHRNHLPIMSLNEVTESSGVYTIDLSSSANVYESANAVSTLAGSSKVGMHAGNTDDDSDIDNDDLATWRSNNGAAYSYSTNGDADFNLDGVINAVDRNEFHQKNTAKTRQLPD